MPDPCAMIDEVSTAGRTVRRQRLKAPRTDGDLVAVPPLADCREVACRNAEDLQTTGVEILGVPLSDLRQQAQREVLQAAKAYTGQWVSQLAAGPQTGLWFVSGHQPGLSHPGVWVKNFVVGELARREEGVGLNLVVDNDIFQGAGIRVPVGTRRNPALETVAFDSRHPAQPWEEVRVGDRDLFASFGDRVTASMENWGIEPLVRQFWPRAIAHLSNSDRIADALTAARNACERDWGTANLELPLSRLCELDSFRLFACHILAELPRFHSVYNAVLHEYREINRIRSRTHPIPDLHTADGWLEAPFWVWRTGEHQRQRLLARTVGQEIWLSDDGRETFARLPLSPEGDPAGMIGALRPLAGQGIRLRTRALTTTLFSRLCFADLFVHGIGGAIYDEITDRIICRFFGIHRPQFLARSATLHLPLQTFEVSPGDEQRLVNQLRALRYNAERSTGAALPENAADIIAEKQRLIEQQQSRNGRGSPDGRPTRQPRGSGPGYARFRRFQEISRELSAYTQSPRQQLMRELERIRGELAANAVMQNREYAFCLYPAEKLRNFMQSVCNF